MGIVGIIWEILKNLPALIQLVKYLQEQAVEHSERNKQKQNEEIKKEVENAETPEQKQDAVSRAATRWGKS